MTMSPSMFGVAGEVVGRHAAAAKLALDGVASLEGRFELVADHVRTGLHRHA